LADDKPHSIPEKGDIEKQVQQTIDAICSEERSAAAQFKRLLKTISTFPVLVCLYYSICINCS
jgi:hypothetical protein